MRNSDWNACKQYGRMGGEGGNMAKYYNQTARKASQKYLLKNTRSVAFRLSKVYEQDLIDIYDSIPNNEKAAWFKQCLKEYGEKHPN